MAPPEFSLQASSVDPPDDPCGDAPVQAKSDPKADDESFDVRYNFWGMEVNLGSQTHASAVAFVERMISFYKKTIETSGFGRLRIATMKDEWKYLAYWKSHWSTREPHKKVPPSEVKKMYEDCVRMFKKYDRAMNEREKNEQEDVPDTVEKPRWSPEGMAVLVKMRSDLTALNAAFAAALSGSWNLPSIQGKLAKKLMQMLGMAKLDQELLNQARKIKNLTSSRRSPVNVYVVGLFGISSNATRHAIKQAPQSKEQEHFAELGRIFYEIGYALQ